MIQTIIVSICIPAAIVYALWRIRKLTRQRHNPCCGCDGCDGCTLKNQICDKK